MDWFLYAIALPVTLLLLASAGCAVHWAIKHGQTRALWRSVRSLFGELPHADEPDPLLPATSQNSSGGRGQS